ncbi:hypothetical protein VCR17J2_50024 [Vibrio coralliirubri]|nr:hypothetical protein VCR17J2_50024 [Vibrio coralliirubri]
MVFERLDFSGFDFTGFSFGEYLCTNLFYFYGHGLVASFWDANSNKPEGRVLSTRQQSSSSLVFSWLRVSP